MKDKERRLNRKTQISNDITNLIGRIGVTLLLVSIIFALPITPLLKNTWLTIFIFIALHIWIACPIANLIKIFIIHKIKK